MKASYNWLKELVDIGMGPGELGHLLTMSGFEVETIEDIDDDTVFDLGITPNRPDCLSIRGIAREIAAITGSTFKDIPVSIKSPQGDAPDIEVQDTSLCNRYVSRIVKGVKCGNSPEWLVKRLESHGIRSTSNIVDVTNYVLLEFGQPLHAFDLDRLSGNRINVRRAGEAMTFITLDGEKRNISKDTLLIWDAERAVAVAGVMGGQNTEVSESTTNILLESAYFKPQSIRRTSRSINLSTESSYRFERGVDIETVPVALDRAAMLIADLAGGEISEITDIYPEKFTEKKIYVSFGKINSLIGKDIDEQFSEDTMKRLGFQPVREGEGMTVTPPSFRNDVQQEVDIVEEIARIYGYDRIPSTMPLSEMGSPGARPSYLLNRQIKNHLSMSGFDEVINFSFMNPIDLERLNLSRDDKRKRLVYIKNPLRKEEEALRSSLVPSLLGNVSLNLNRGEKMLRFFELSRIFIQSGGSLPDETLQLGAVLHKDKVPSLWQNDHDGFYDLKGAVERLFYGLRIRNFSFEKEHDAAEPYLHPGKSCAIMIQGLKIGAIGAIHPSVSDAFDLHGDSFIMEIFSIDKLKEMMTGEIKFNPLPRFPYVERDLAVLLPTDISVADTEKVIHGIDADIIESVRLFDIYTGKSIPKGKRSLAFSIRYRSSDRTLTDNEVDAVHSSIIKSLEQNLGAELR